MMAWLEWIKAVYVDNKADRGIPDDYSVHRLELGTLFNNIP